MDISRRNALLAAGAAALFAPFTGASSATAATPTSHTAFSADAVRDSVGVCVHPTYTSTLYAQTQLIIDSIVDLGIKHYRTESYNATPPAYLSSFITNARNAGLKAQLIADKGWGTNASGFISQLANYWTPAGISGVEGQNEPDNFSTIASAQATQAALYPAFRADSRFNGIPFLNPSMAQYKNYSVYGNDGREDGLNMHGYEASFNTMPEGGRIDEWINSIRATFGSTKPLYETEHGYTNAVGYNTNWYVDEYTAGSYLIRSILYYYAYKNIKRSFSYELFDEKPAAANVREQHFGLVAITGGSTPSTYTTRQKESYGIIKRLLGRIKESTLTTAPPTTMDYALTGAPSDLKAVPIARKSGAYDLALWRAAPLWDASTQKRLVPATVNVQIDIPTAKLIHTYRPVNGALVNISDSTTHATIPVDGQVTLVRVG